MRKILRRIRSSAALRELIARGGAAYIRLVFRTVRWERHGQDHVDRLQAGNGRHILAIWHGRLLMIPAEMRAGLTVHAVISANKDGDIIAAAVGKFGIGAIRGSSADPRKPQLDKKGRAVADKALEALRGTAPCLVALSPDGPRGPRMRCQRGVALFSAATGIEVTPWTFSTRRARLMRSWDRFMVPLPFDRGVLMAGEPIPAPTADDDATIEAHRLKIETALLALNAQADALCGRAPVAPDARPAYPGKGAAAWPPAA